jgi:hypothetical protein
MWKPTHRGVEAHIELVRFVVQVPLADQAPPEANCDGVGAGSRLQLREQVPYVRLHRFLREEQPDTDLAIHEAVRDELENLDLAGGRFLLELLEGPAERDDLGAVAASPLRHRVKAAAVVDVSGQDLLTLGSVHGNRTIGLASTAL